MRGFRKYPPSQSDTDIHDSKVEVFDEYKYLGKTVIEIEYLKLPKFLSCSSSFNFD